MNGLQCPTFERLAVPSLSWLAPHVPVVGQAGRLWNVSLEEQGTLIPMEDIAERLGVDVGMILSHLNRGRGEVRDVVDFIESHLVEAWFYTDVGSSQQRMRIPPVALPTCLLDAPADIEGYVDFYLLHVRYGDYDLLLTCCEVDLAAWCFASDGSSAMHQVEAGGRVQRSCFCWRLSYYNEPVQVAATFAEHAAFHGP